MVIADDHSTLVGSGDLLAPGSSEQAALWVRPQEPPQASSAQHAVLQLLAWTRSRCPDSVLGQSILTPADFATRHRELPRTTEQPEFPSIPEETDTAYIPIWHRSWTEYHAMLAETVRAVPEGMPAVEVLLDGEIHQAIANLVQQVGQRLAIANDTTASLPLRRRLLVDVEERWKNGVDVRIDCPEPSGGPTHSPLDRIPGANNSVHRAAAS